MYQLKLKVGDLIQATVVTLNSGKITVDTSRWANVDTAYLADVSENASIVPGAEIYAEVADVESGSARLEQKRGTYRRNHLPGDTLRVQTTERVSSKLCKAAMDEPRNIDSLYVVGASICADVTVNLKKLRGQTAIALPSVTHHPGLVTGERVTIEMTAGSMSAPITGVPNEESQIALPNKTVLVDLPEPAPASGPATVRITDDSEENLMVILEDIPADLPARDEYFKTSVTENLGYTTLEIDDTGVEIKIELEHSCPITGYGLIKVDNRQNGIYQGRLVEYIDPEIKPDGQYNATVSGTTGQAHLTNRGQNVSVDLIEDVSSTGNATVKVKKISDELKGTVLGDIEPIDIDDAETQTVDITNLSKL